MCNRYSNKVAYRQYYEAFMKTPMPLVYPMPDRAPNLEPRADIRPTDNAPILRAGDGGLELRQIRWGLIPWFHKASIKTWKPLTTNARIETITKTATYKSAFAQRRCLVPADTFYEWTGEKGHKTKWAFKLANAEWFCFAGIWDKAQTEDGEIESFSLVTCEASAYVKPYHDRQPIILDHSNYSLWLDTKIASKAEDLNSREIIIVNQTTS